MTTGYVASGKRLGDLEHGFGHRVIECKCGLRYPPDKFEQHLRDAATDKMRLAIGRAMTNAPGTATNVPRQPGTYATGTLEPTGIVDWAADTDRAGGRG